MKKLFPEAALYRYGSDGTLRSINNSENLPILIRAKFASEPFYVP
jgi:hypothetical protein